MRKAYITVLSKSVKTDEYGRILDEKADDSLIDGKSVADEIECSYEEMREILREMHKEYLIDLAPKSQDGGEVGVFRVRTEGRQVLISQET